MKWPTVLKVVVILQMVVSSAPLFAKENLIFRHLTIEDGLSQGAVYAIFQDRQGFIWIGTKDGLNKYDGYRFTIYKHDSFDSTSLSNNYITALFEDAQNNLWVGTLSGGLNRLDRRTNRFRRYRFPAADSITQNRNHVIAITEDRWKNMWIATRDGLLCLPAEERTSATPQFRVYQHHPDDPTSINHNYLQSMRLTHDGNLWIGTSGGLNMLDLSTPPTEVKFRRYILDHGPPRPDSDNNIFAIFQAADQILWLGTVSGIIRFEPESGHYQLFPHHYHNLRRGWGNVFDIIEARDGKLWMTTPDELMIFDPTYNTYQYYKHEFFNPASINSNGLTVLIRDQSDVIWIATNGYGINIHDPKANRFQVYRRPKNFPSRISRFSITSLLEDSRGDVWIGADVLYRWNRDTDRLISYETDSQHPEDFGNTGIHAMIEDHQGNLWVSSYEGLYRYRLEDGQVQHFKTDPNRRSNKLEKGVYGVIEGRDQKIWYVTEYYFNCLDPVSGKSQHYRYREQLPKRSLSGIFQDRQGRFWLGTDMGLARFDPASGRFKYYRNDPAQPGTISSNVVRAICEDPLNPRQVLWLGTAGGGLNRFEMQTEQFTHFTEKDGLPNDVVYSILPDSDGNLWLSTNKGLSRFNPPAGQFRNFDISDGLQSNEFNTGAYFKSHSGEMFFGGINGLNYFHPEQIVDNQHIPTVIITGLRISNKAVSSKSHPAVLKSDISESGKIFLTYRENIISFEFTALDYSAPERNQYAYMLEGFNEGWIENGTARSATYTNLPPGEYVFRVKGSNNDGVWNEQGASLIVHVAPPPWRTWWAYSLYAALILSLLWGIRKYELNRIYIKNRWQVERLDAEKLRDLDRIKSRFFANISHEFRTPLTLILGQLDRSIAASRGEEDRRRLEVALRNARRLLRLINQLLDLSRLEAGSMSLRAESGNLVSFLGNIVASFDSLAEQKRISLSFTSDVPVAIVKFDVDKLEKVFYNLLSNAFKFTPEGGFVRVECNTEDLALDNLDDPKSATNKVVRICVKDTGPGIPQDQLPLIFDRFYQVDMSGTRAHEGSGIGLALARELVDLHNGRITVESAPEKGSTFTIILPLEITSQESKHSPRREVVLSPAASTTETVSAPEPANGSGREWILIVEDNTDVRNYIKEHLQSYYRVLEAANGQAGLEIARQKIPDLIISDVMMPGMDGKQLTGKLKNDQRTSHIPIIMVTARAELDDKIAGLQTGADAYLTKPFSARELEVRVQNLIALRRELQAKYRSAAVIKPAEVAATSIDREFLEKTVTAIEANMEDAQFDVSRLAEIVGMSVSQINRKLSALIGQPAGKLVRSMRLQRGADLLSQNAGTVAEICYQVGFGDQANFTRAFKKQFGVAPGAYRKSHGEHPPAPKNPTAS